MTTKYKELVKGAALTSTTASLYAPPANTYAAIHAASVNNPTAAPVIVSLYKGTAGNASTLICKKTVGTNATAQFPEMVNHKLEPGGSQIWGDGAGCNVNISGVEYVPDNT